MNLKTLAEIRKMEALIPGLEMAMQMLRDPMEFGGAAWSVENRIAHVKYSITALESTLDYTGFADTATEAFE